MPKRTKSIKKTDIKGNKPWLKKVKPHIYKIETEEPNKFVLITCEGQTEKLYLEAFPVLTVTVKAIDLQGQSKLTLIEATLSIIENSKQEYDEVWCVFDMDFKRGAQEFADFDNAIEKTYINKLKVAYSNDVFELWFYLHFEYTEQQHHRTFYYAELGKRWDINYVRFGKKKDFSSTIYERLNDDENASQEDAIKRAEKLFEEQSDLPFHQQNPVTLVSELVIYLNENSRR